MSETGCKSGLHLGFLSFCGHGPSTVTPPGRLSSKSFALTKPSPVVPGSDEMRLRLCLSESFPTGAPGQPRHSLPIRASLVMKIVSPRRLACRGPSGRYTTESMLLAKVSGMKLFFSGNIMELWTRIEIEEGMENSVSVRVF